MKSIRRVQGDSGYACLTAVMSGFFFLASCTGNVQNEQDTPVAAQPKSNEVLAARPKTGPKPATAPTPTQGTGAAAKKENGS